MKTLRALALCLFLIPAAQADAASGPVTDAAGLDAAMSAGGDISLSGKTPIVLPERPLPQKLAGATFSTPHGPVHLKGGAPNGRLLHSESPDVALRFTGPAEVFFNGFSVTGLANTPESGWGGVWYVENNLNLTAAGPLIFIGNRADGGASAADKSAHSSGMGGAFCVDGTFRASGETIFLFAGNKAEAGKAGIGGAVENSGQGGAIYVEKGLQIESGHWNFTANQAQGSPSIALKSQAFDSGYGGALNSTYELVLGRAGDYLFIGNSARGGKSGLSGNADAAGQGGAVYGVDNMELAGAVFLGNSAGTDNIGDLSSGVGGAIYHEGYGNDYVVTLRGLKDKPLFFAGNTHNPGGRGAELNSLYIGNTQNELNARSVTSVVVDCEVDGRVIMLDPMASQAEITSGKKPENRLAEVVVGVHKTGPGLWVLGGRNRFAGQAEFRVAEGSLRLTRDAFGGPARIALLSDKAAEFSLEQGTVLEISPWTEAAAIEAGDIALKPGSAVRLADTLYKAELKTDAPVTLLRLKAGSTLNIGSSLPVTSGSLEVGGKTYAFHGLAWQINGNEAELRCVFEAK